MKLKNAILTGAAAFLCVTSSLNVSAAEMIPSNSLKTLKGKENLIIDVAAYREAYSDLDAAFGDDTDAYIRHYLSYGIYEGRTKGALFDPLTYANTYSDIKNTFGDDIFAIIDHYMTFGIAENRTAGTANGYTDIAEAAEHGEYQRAVTPQISSSSTGNNYATQTGAIANVSSSFHHSTSIYADDGKTLLRVEYYTSPYNLAEYSDIMNFDASTNSYTENIYYYDEVNKVEVLKRTDTYVNGVLVSSKVY